MAWADVAEELIATAMDRRTKRRRATTSTKREEGDRACLMPFSPSMAPRKWKAGSGEGDDEGRRQLCHGLPKEGG